ncbi:hypothetical protein HNY73_007372 [Argiope bruennichi]|uniref:Uncharacterized protein n=1 Tax=Argiope bruennichi TaxID=94029 RepID=A0A8T0FDR6_ARGBR|nr:hypothetical protein HNY73_007372 [Argiope bruennichi]
MGLASRHHDWSSFQEILNSRCQGELEVLEKLINRDWNLENGDEFWRVEWVFGHVRSSAGGNTKAEGGQEKRGEKIKKKSAKGRKSREKEGGNVGYYTQQLKDADSTIADLRNNSLQLVDRNLPRKLKNDYQSAPKCIRFKLRSLKNNQQVQEYGDNAEILQQWKHDGPCDVGIKVCDKYHERDIVNPVSGISKTNINKINGKYKKFNLEKNVSATKENLFTALQVKPTPIENMHQSVDLENEDLYSLVEELKIKSATTSYADKIQILTLVPKSWESRKYKD